MVRTEAARGVLLVFVDGVGIGTRDARRNPLFHSPPPFLRELLGGALPSLRQRWIETGDAVCLPLDARLGVAGLPQSGTGQSTLYSGVNTARLIGRHFGPYLYSTTKPVLVEHSIFARMNTLGLRATLANAFPQRFFDYLDGPRKRMVAGMYAALTAGLRFRTINDLKRGEAVSTDITAERWPAIGHPDAPLSTAYEAGRTLARIASRYAFTMFEYFATDKAGHERSMELASRALLDVDALLRGVHDGVRHDRTLVLLTSDHGNMEELSVKTHTRNPVPLILFGARDGFDAGSLHNLSHLVPAICKFLS